MKKNPFLLLLIILGSSLSLSRAQFITTATNQVGPGVVHRKIIDPWTPWELNVLEIDLTDPHISIESHKADQQLVGREKLSAMITRIQSDSHHVVGAINGDFFDGDGIPINSQVIDGELLKKENIDPSNPIYWSTIGIDLHGRPAISTNYYSGTVMAKGISHSIEEINHARSENQLVLYNSYYGSSTNTGSSGREILIDPVERWLVNDRIACLVTNTAAGNMAIPSHQAVLSGSGTMATFLTDNVNLGDTIKIYLELSGQKDKLKELVGGFPRIVRDGENYALQGYHAEGGGSTFATDRHPRTGVGFSADSTKLYFVVVDGRQSFSRGMDLPELADFMIGQGVAWGLNLDGGGSTEMIVRNEIENSPSDGFERAVSNGLFVISQAPAGELHAIQVAPDNYRLFKGQSLAFKVSGWDQNYHPHSIDQNSVQFQVAAGLGSISDGTFHADAINDSGYVLVNYNELQDSAFVYLKAIRDFCISPKNCITDTIHPVNFDVQIIDEDGFKHSFPQSEFTWQCLDPEFGQIDTLGQFCGTAPGMARVKVSYAGFTDTAFVNIQVFAGQTVLNAMDDLSNWELDGEYLELGQSELSITSSPRTQGSGALRLDYQFIRQSAANSWAYLKTDIYIGGIPQAVCFDFKSDGNQHIAYLAITDDNGQAHQVVIPEILDDSTQYDTLSTLEYNQNYAYPLQLKAIQIKLGNSAPIDSLNKGTLYLDNLRVSYAPLSVKGRSVDLPMARVFELHKNYPNPFNPETTIHFQLFESHTVRLVIYDLKGQLVQVLTDQFYQPGNYKVSWDGTNERGEPVPSGLYFYRLSSQGSGQTRKMILLR